MKIEIVEWWEKLLEFLAFDCAAIEFNIQGSVRIHFMTMYGEVYFQSDHDDIESARTFLEKCRFRKFDPTPERLQFRGPHQVSHFYLAETPKSDRIFLEA
jgi:hypothetical protein